MSTRAIRMVLKEFGKERDWLMIQEALQEVEEIERAATTVLRDKADEFVSTKDIDAAYALMKAIAKDAP